MLDSAAGSDQDAAADLVYVAGARNRHRTRTVLAHANAPLTDKVITEKKQMQGVIEISATFKPKDGKPAAVRSTARRLDGTVVIICRAAVLVVAGRRARVRPGWRCQAQGGDLRCTRAAS